MDGAIDYGSIGCRFEAYWGHIAEGNPYSLTDRILGSGPSGRGSNPLRGTNDLTRL